MNIKLFSFLKLRLPLNFIHRFYPLFYQILFVYLLFNEKFIYENFFIKRESSYKRISCSFNVSKYLILPDNLNNKFFSPNIKENLLPLNNLTPGVVFTAFLERIILREFEFVYPCILLGIKTVYK